MTDEERFFHWINVEIPTYLNRFSSFREFDKHMPSVAASGEWKKAAYVMAAERWKVKIKHIPR